jgi:hypothetical protein
MPQRMIVYARTVENVWKVEVVSDDIAKPNSGLDLVVRKPKIQKVKEKKKTKIKVENIGLNKIVVCTEMVIYYT